MGRTPGFIDPQSFKSEELFAKKLREQAEEHGFTPLDEGMIHSSDEEAIADFLAHYGVKGMKWGVRRDRTPGVSRKTDREARKDAKEFARAKVFYGEGAGNRRKLIKATVEGKSKKDSSYKKAFDAHLDRQDTSKHASKARSERKRKDVKKSTGKTFRGVSHMLRGNPQYASAAAATLVGGALYIHRSGIDKAILNTSKTKISDLSDKLSKMREGRGAKTLSDLLKDLGVET